MIFRRTNWWEFSLQETEEVKDSDYMRDFCSRLFLLLVDLVERDLTRCHRVNESSESIKTVCRDVLSYVYNSSICSVNSAKVRRALVLTNNYLFMSKFLKIIVVTDLLRNEWQKNWSFMTSFMGVGKEQFFSPPVHPGENLGINK